MQERKGDRRHAHNCAWCSGTARQLFATAYNLLAERDATNGYHTARLAAKDEALRQAVKSAQVEVDAHFRILSWPELSAGSA